MHYTIEVASRCKASQPKARKPRAEVSMSDLQGGLEVPSPSCRVCDVVFGIRVEGHRRNSKRTPLCAHSQGLGWRIWHSPEQASVTSSLCFCPLFSTLPVPAVAKLLGLISVSMDDIVKPPVP